MDTPWIQPDSCLGYVRHIPVILDGVKCHALRDSGSDINIISKRLATALAAKNASIIQPCDAVHLGGVESAPACSISSVAHIKKLTLLFPKPIILDRFALSIFDTFYVHPNMDTTRHDVIIGCPVLEELGLSVRMPLDEVDDSIDQADPRDPLLYKPDPELLPNAESFAPLSATQASALAAIHSKRSNVFNDRVDDPALFDPFDVEIDPEKAHLLETGVLARGQHDVSIRPTSTDAIHHQIVPIRLVVVQSSLGARGR